MKKEKISQALGNINTKFVEEATDYTSGETVKMAGRRNWLKFAVAAAVFCLLAAGTVLIVQQVFFKQPEQIIEDNRWPIKEVEQGEARVEDALVPNWEDMTISRQFSYVEYGNIEYSSRETQLDASHVGTSLGSVVMTGHDWITDEKHSINATLYSVAEFPQECVIAVQFEGREDYYVYVNSYYCPQTLGEFIEDLNLRENVSFGSVWYSCFYGNGEYATVEFVDLPDSVVWEMLCSDTGVKNVHQDGFGGQHPTVMSISVDIPLLGYKNISLAVTEDGYLTSNILDTGKAFYIGVDKVQAFVDYVIENCEGYQIVYVNPSDDIQPESGVTDAPEKQNWPEATPAVATPMPAVGMP